MMLLTRFRNKLHRIRQGDFDKATEQDLRYCYRLFLNREPDEMGWAHYTRLIKRNNISTQYLTASFLGSSEFRNIQARLNAPTLVELPRFDMYVRLNDFFIGAAIARHRSYEPQVTREIESLLKPESIFVDVGANIGFFTMLAASLVNPKGQVFAFEPNPDNCQLIRQSITKNGFNHVQVYQNALAESAQTFNFSVDNSNGRIMHESETNENLINYQVQAVTLDETLPDLPRLDLIKMDIEGAEPRAWQGMIQTIQKYRPIIILEFSPSTIQITCQTQPVAFLESLQEEYELFILPDVGQKSEHAQSNAAIMQWFTDSRHHVDLIAYPR